MEGRRVPEVIFKTRVRDDALGGDNPFRWQDLPSRDIFDGRRVVVFSLPGAFTPTCSNEQCPAFERHFEDIKAAGGRDLSRQRRDGTPRYQGTTDILDPPHDRGSR